MASALSLIPVSRLTVPGSADVRAVQPLPDGLAALCLGSRWVQLGMAGNDAGQLERSVPTVGKCESLALSPDGKRLVSGAEGGFEVWNVADGSRVLARPVPMQPAQAGFLSNDVVLFGTSNGVDTLNLQSGQRQTVKQGAVKALFVAPDGKRAVIGDGQRVQLVSLSDFRVLSGHVCESDCNVKNAHFSADGRTAAVQVGDMLIGLRAGLPSTTVLRRVSAAVGLPQPNNTVLTVTGVGLESHDLQTGRREKVLLSEGLQPVDAAQNGSRLLLLSKTGELLNTDLNGADLKRWPLPATPTAGGLDASGGVYTLHDNDLALNGKALPGIFWDVQTMNKTTWALRSFSDGLMQSGTLKAGEFTPIPGSPRTATHLSVNFWGNTAAVWDDKTLWVVSQPKNKVVNTVKLGGPLNWAMLSPDATRVYLYPGKLVEGVPDILNLATGQRSAVPEPYRPAGGWVNAVQFNGVGGGMFLGSRENLDVIDPKKNPAFNGAREALGTLARYSPDSKWLAYVGRNQAAQPVLKLLNLPTGQDEATSPPLADLPTFLTWSADSKKLAVRASLASELTSVTVFEVR